MPLMTGWPNVGRFAGWGIFGRTTGFRNMPWARPGLVRLMFSFSNASLSPDSVFGVASKLTIIKAVPAAHRIRVKAAHKLEFLFMGYLQFRTVKLQFGNFVCPCPGQNTPTPARCRSLTCLILRVDQIFALRLREEIKPATPRPSNVTVLGSGTAA